MRRPIRSWLHVVLLALLAACPPSASAQGSGPGSAPPSTPLSDEEQASLEATRDFVRAAATRYRMLGPLEVSVASWVGTGGLPQYANAPAVYTRGALYLNRRLLPGLEPGPRDREGARVRDAPDAEQGHHGGRARPGARRPEPREQRAGDRHPGRGRGADGGDGPRGDVRVADRDPPDGPHRATTVTARAASRRATRSRTSSAVTPRSGSASPAASARHRSRTARARGAGGARSRSRSAG